MKKNVKLIYLFEGYKNINVTTATATKYLFQVKEISSYKQNTESTFNQAKS